jgi:subtilisin family serine protease
MVAIRPVSLAILMLALLPASAAANSPTQIIVKREAGLSAAERRDIRADADVRFVESLPLPRTEVVAAAPGDVRDALRDLNADPGVVYAERDRPIEALSDDPDFDNLWGLENDGSLVFTGDPGVADADMDVPDAWASSTGRGRTVAVVDSGVDANHPDLSANVVAGWDLVDDDPVANDLDDHGTHVAGTLAATRDETGMVGVAPDARILPLRVLDENGDGLVSDAISAYHLAAERGVAIVNASLGGEGFVQSEYDAIASHPEVLFVVAAGNDGQNNDVAAQSPEYPCSYDLANILCVGASRNNEQRASFSNYGPTTVDLFAPGFGIYSAVPGGGYDWKNGTSMATPHVAGAAALLAARNPELTSEQIKSAIMSSAEPKSTYAGLAVTGGRANANEALLELDTDGDGVAEGEDNCPAIANEDQGDDNGDGEGDACELGSDDADGDGVPVPDDLCPAEPAPYDADGCTSGAPWIDGDTRNPDVDNCPSLANEGQENLDGDRLGDACDPDLDGDGRANGADNCPTVGNNQADRDNDGIGDACDNDFDGDGHANASDNCPTIWNAQGNADGDHLGDACDPTPRGDDPDGDGKAWIDDVCPTVYGTLANGCPATVAAPPAAEVERVSAKVSKRGRKRSARVTVSTTGPATVRITVERKRGRRWVRVTRKTRAIAGSRTVLKVSRLKRGKHRVRISISSSGGRGSSVSKSFRVR